MTKVAITDVTKNDIDKVLEEAKKVFPDHFSFFMFYDDKDLIFGGTNPCPACLKSRLELIVSQLPDVHLDDNPLASLSLDPLDQARKN